MKKALATLMAALAVMSSVPAIPTQALDPIMKGDLNFDGNVNISDAVIMQKYLLGKYEENFVFSTNTSYAADINDDGSVDVYDFILLKQMFERSDNKISKTFTRCADSLPEDMHYSKPSGQGEAVITSVNELKEYFQPNMVMLTTGECATIEVASQEVIDDYLARYDENFFANNVLCLKFLSGTDKYAYQSVQYDDSSLIIQYYDATDPNLHWNVPLPPYIAEVAVPINLWADGEVVWEEVDAPFTPQIRTEITTAIDTSAIKYAVANSFPDVIQNVSQLEYFIDGKFGYGVQESLKSTYDENYFNDNVMIFDIYYQDYDNFRTSVDVEKNEFGDIEVNYDILEADGEAEGMKLSIISIPKEQYHNEAVIRTKTWETPIEASLIEFDLFSISQALESDSSLLNFGSLWVSSYEEFEALFTGTMTPSFYETIIKSAENIDWSTKSAYIWVDTDIIASTHKLLSASKDENGLTLKFSSQQPLSCMGGKFLHIVTVDKKYEGSSVTRKNLNLNDDFPMTGGECLILPVGNNGTNILIDQYTFGDKNVASVYQLYNGGGPARFNGYQYLGSIDLPLGYSGFCSMEDYTLTENEDGSTTATTQNVTAINYRDANDNNTRKLKITFTVPDSGEVIEKIFTY